MPLGLQHQLLYFKQSCFNHYSTRNHPGNRCYVEFPHSIGPAPTKKYAASETIENSAINVRLESDLRNIHHEHRKNIYLQCSKLPIPIKQLTCWHRKPFLQHTNHHWSGIIHQPYIRAA